MRRLIGIIVIVVLIVAVAGLAYAAVGDPERLAIRCAGEGNDQYFKAVGKYRVSAFVGDNNGAFESIEIEDVNGAPILSLAFPAFFGVGESHGEAFVRTTVTGPNDEVVEDWESKHTKFDFNSGDLVSGQSKQGSWSGPTVCFDSPGESTWDFQLFWEDDNGEQLLASDSRSVSVE